MINIPVSIGEAFDKYSILEIKKVKLTEYQRSNVQREMDFLKNEIISFLSIPSIFTLYKQIFTCNIEIWECMDLLYILHDNEEINGEYSLLCYKVTELNKRRAYIKREIDDYLGSQIKEEKSYFMEDSNEN